MSLNRPTISVSELTSQLKKLIESNFSNIWIQGEISNFKHHSSGHMYFIIKDQGAELDYDELAQTTLLHGSPDTVIRRLQELEEMTGITSLVLHYPPYYGIDNTLKSLRLFAEEVIPAFRIEAAA